MKKIKEISLSAGMIALFYATALIPIELGRHRPTDERTEFVQKSVDEMRVSTSVKSFFFTEKGKEPTHCQYDYELPLDPSLQLDDSDIYVNFNQAGGVSRVVMGHSAAKALDASNVDYIKGYIEKVNRLCESNKTSSS